ncbi:MAG: PKD domain-containing protein [Anaerolineaceae bacterium]|nr:MAG: PKD domain-containing protein [Anaerolineaceae bacterium]
MTLTVINESGGSSKTVAITISQAVTSESETVGFSYTVGDISAQFTDTSTKPGARLWDFGDNTTSTEINPHHLFPSTGVYTVTLTIEGTSISQQVAIDTGVLLSWQDNSGDETGFKVEHSLNGVSGWSQIATTAAGVNTLLVTKNLHAVDPTVLNYFRVRAYNAGGNSTYTNIASVQCGV